MTDDVGMENDGAGHTHVWGRDMGACVCGEPVPAYLVAAWNRYAERSAEIAEIEGGGS